MQEESITKKGSFFQHFAKVIMLGDYGVGKTSILQLINQGTQRTSFSGVDSQSAIINENQLMKFTYDNFELLLKIWDTAGQEKYRSITISFYKEVRGVFLCFDLTNRESFLNLQLWIRQIRQHAEENVVKILLGNKCDLHDQRQVSDMEIHNLKQDLGCSYFQTSVKTGENIEEIFKQMADQIKEKIVNIQFQEDDAMILKSKRRGQQKLEDDRSICFC